MEYEKPSIGSIRLSRWQRMRIAVSEPYEKMCDKADTLCRLIEDSTIDQNSFEELVKEFEEYPRRFLF